MFIESASIVFQEVPGEISLCFLISGCTLRCPGCHSSYSWKTRNKEFMSEIDFEIYIKKYVNMITCILFMGGEWNDTLPNYLRIAKRLTFKTALYTGLTLEQIDIKKYNLDYIKVGQWIEKLGGLDNPNTNQKFINLNTGKDSTYLFQVKKKETNDIFNSGTN